MNDEMEIYGDLRLSTTILQSVSELLVRYWLATGWEMV